VVAASGPPHRVDGPTAPVLLFGFHPVPVFVGCADAEGFQEPALSRLGDNHGAAVPHPFDPTEVEAAIGERCANCTSDVQPAFRPVEAGPTKVAALCAGSKKVDPEFREEPRAFVGDFTALVAEHDVFPRTEEIGEINAEATRKVVVAHPGRAKLLCLARQGAVSRSVFERYGHDPVEHLDNLRCSEAKVSVAPVLNRSEQSRIAEFCEMSTRRLRCDSRGISKLGSRKGAAIEKR